jgi:putative flippase GtrA
MIVGCINTFVGYGTYALMIFCGFSYVAAQAISTVVGVTNSYFWNKYFTFKKPQKSVVEILRFVSVYVFGYLVSLAVLFFCIDLLNINAYIAGLVGLIFTTAISYIGHNYFSFGPGKRIK